jgi:hypothetical protein
MLQPVQTRLQLLLLQPQHPKHLHLHPLRLMLRPPTMIKSMRSSSGNSFRPSLLNLTVNLIHMSALSAIPGHGSPLLLHAPPHLCLGLLLWHSGPHACVR